MKNKITEEMLTAFIMDELDSKKREQVKQALKNDPQLMEEYREVKAFCSTLHKEIQVKKKSEKSEQIRKKIHSHLEQKE